MMLEVARRSFSRLLKPMMIYLGIALFASSISLNHPTLLMAPTITVLIIALGLLAACVLFCDSESQDRFRYHNLLPLPEFSYFAGRVAGGLLGLGFGFWVFWIFLLFHESRGSVGEIGFLHLVPLVLQGICYGTSLYLVRISLFAKRGRGGSLKTSLKGSRIWLYLAAGFFISAIISESLINPKHLIIHPYYRYTLFPDVFSHQVDILLIFHISVFAFSLSIFVMAFAKQFLEGFLLCIFSFLAISYLVLGWLPWVLSLKPVYLLTSTTIFLFWIGWRVHNISEIAPSPQLRQGWLWRAFLKFFSVMLIWFLISIARVGLMDQPQEILGVDLNPNSGLLMVLSEHNHWSLKWLLVEEEILQSIQVFSPEGKSLSKLPDVIKLQQPTTDYFLEVEPVKPFYASSVKLSVYKGNGTKALKKKTMEFDHLLLPNRGYPNWNQPQLKKATIIDGIDPDTGSVYYHERREYYLGTTYYKMSIGSAMPERLKGIHPWGSSFPEGRLEVIPEKPFNNETFPRIRAQNRLFNLKASHKQYLDEKQDKNSLKTRDLEWLGRADNLETSWLEDKTHFETETGDLRLIENEKLIQVKFIKQFTNSYEYLASHLQYRAIDLKTGKRTAYIQKFAQLHEPLTTRLIHSQGHTYLLDISDKIRMYRLDSKGELEEVLTRKKEPGKRRIIRGLQQFEDRFFVYAVGAIDNYSSEVYEIDPIQKTISVTTLPKNTIPFLKSLRREAGELCLLIGVESIKMVNQPLFRKLFLSKKGAVLPTQNYKPMDGRAYWFDSGAGFVARGGSHEASN